jgi:hypothetical protein
VVTLMAWLVVGVVALVAQEGEAQEGERGEGK